MQAEATHDAPKEAAATLVAHLRQNPQDALSDPEDLARRLNLDPRFVEQVLEAVQPPRAGAERRVRISFQFLSEWLERALQTFDSLILHPRRFLVLTLLACLAINVGLDYATSLPLLNRIALLPELGFGAGFLVILATGVLHMACYFRKRMVRYALFGGLFMWIALGIALAFEIVRNPEDLPTKASGILTMGIGVGMLSLLYTALGSVAAVVGGYVHLKRQEIREVRMTRQELLERYIELRDRLRKGVDLAPEERDWNDWAAVEAYRENPLFWSFFAGLLLALAQTLILGAANVHPLRISPATNLPIFTVLAVFGVLTFLAFLTLGFLSRGVGKAIASALVFSAGSALPALIPLGHFGPEYFTATTLTQMGISTFAMTLVATIAAMGGRVQEQHYREASLSRNEQAALAAEMLRIQWRLSGGMQSICVMVIDAARSSEMKAAADPLVVEYSFREYQEWIEAICAEFGGRVHSTAGDGAVVSFPDCENAFNAARRLQTDIARFNREVNQLRSPFRLRIGLHVGQVAGDLEEVVFSSVIDTAAHVQEAAPVSGIAVTEAVALELPHHDFALLAKEIDGQRVHLALDPVED